MPVPATELQHDEATQPVARPVAVAVIGFESRLVEWALSDVMRRAGAHATVLRGGEQPDPGATIDVAIVDATGPVSVEPVVAALRRRVRSAHVIGVVRPGAVVNGRRRCFDVELDAATGIEHLAALAVSPGAADAPVRRPSPALTARQLGIFHALGTGLTASETAVRLDLRPSTVEKHRRHLAAALGATTRAHVVARGSGAARSTQEIPVLGRPGLLRDAVEHLVRDETPTLTTGGRPLAVVVDPTEADWALVPEGTSVLAVDHALDAAGIVARWRRGADAVVTDDPTPAQVRMALHALAQGGAVVDGAQARIALDRLRALERAARALSPRERDVLASIGAGDLVKQTARRLGIAEKTVVNVQTRLYRKLGARNRAHAVAIARAEGLLEDAGALAP